MGVVTSIYKKKERIIVLGRTLAYAALLFKVLKIKKAF